MNIEQIIEKLHKLYLYADMNPKSQEDIEQLFLVSYTDLLKEIVKKLEKEQDRFKPAYPVEDIYYVKGLDTAISIIKDKLSPKEDSIN